MLEKSVKDCTLKKIIPSTLIQVQKGVNLGSWQFFKTLGNLHKNHHMGGNVFERMKIAYGNAYYWDDATSIKYNATCTYLKNVYRCLHVHWIMICPMLKKVLTLILGCGEVSLQMTMFFKNLVKMWTSWLDSFIQILQLLQFLIQSNEQIKWTKSWSYLIPFACKSQQKSV